MSNDHMAYNKVTLSFSKDEELRFMDKYFADSLTQFRLSFILVTSLYAMFGYLDIRLMKEFVNLFHLIRYAIVVPLLMFVLLLSFFKPQLFRKIWQSLIFVSVVVGGTGIALMVLIAPLFYEYYAGLMLVFSAGYFFVRLRFSLATIAGWTILILYNLGAIFIYGTPKILLLSNNFFFISANLIGMFAAYNIEFYARRSYFLNQKLDQEKLYALEVNKNLEVMVEERTHELMEAKEKAEESERLKSSFLTNMSHEIRTPMNGILGFMDLLQNPELSGEERNEYITIVRASGDRLLHTINDIIDISRIESGEYIVTQKAVNINALLIELYKFFSPEAEKKGIALQLSNTLPIAESGVLTDKSKLESILTNLIKNAIKFTFHGSIEFGCHLKDNNYLFYVKDTGAGIPANHVNSIFNRFVQGDTSHSRPYEGSGLGLSISKAYTEMLSGKIWVESEVNSGSVFYTSLPLKCFHAAPQQQQKEVQNETPYQEIKKLNILICEDDEVSEILISTALKDVAGKFFKAITGEEALKICHEYPDLDIIMMDIKMPLMDGYETTQEIRKFNKNVIIIAVTAFANPENEEAAIEAGCNDFLSKPINLDKLKQLIQKHFKAL